MLYWRQFKMVIINKTKSSTYDQIYKIKSAKQQITNELYGNLKFFVTQTYAGKSTTNLRSWLFD